MRLAGLVLFITVAISVGVLATAPQAEAHRDGCHRWHTCPSDTGSYVCGDLGYPCMYPTTPATLPDADSDGVPDVSDACPGQFGPQPTGCPPPTAPPDSDADGFADLEDLCPSTWAFETTASGCPDSDEDGKADKVDACDYRASAEPDGCPVAARTSCTTPAACRTSHSAEPSTRASARTSWQLSARAGRARSC
jgi:hypothetical protein